MASVKEPGRIYSAKPMPLIFTPTVDPGPEVLQAPEFPSSEFANKWTVLR